MPGSTELDRASDAASEIQDRVLRRWLVNAQLGDHLTVGRAASRLLDRDLPPHLKIKLLIVLGVAQYTGGRMHDAQRTATGYLALATDLDSPGAASEALAMRAAARLELDDAPGALDDLIEAEVQLARCLDPVTAAGAHQSLGNTYAELRFFELAEPHFLVAIAGERRVIANPTATVADRLNLGSLHYRWAQHLQRMGDAATLPEQQRHLLAALHRLQDAEQHAGGPDHPYWPLIGSFRLGVEGALDPVQALPLVRARAAHAGELRGDNEAALMEALLSRTLRAIGEVDAALDAAHAAARRLHRPGVVRSTTAEVYHELHLAELVVGVPGASEVGGYLRTVIAEMARQRDDSQESLRARRDFALLQDRHDRTTRLAQEDPLTAVGNRRALGRVAVPAPRGPGRTGDDRPRRIQGHQRRVRPRGPEIRCWWRWRRPCDRPWAGPTWSSGTAATSSWSGPSIRTARWLGWSSRSPRRSGTYRRAGSVPRRAITATIGASAAAEGEPTASALQRADRLMLAAKLDRPTATPQQLAMARDRRRRRST